MAEKHIFISYRSIEKEFALRFAHALSEKGYKIWMDRLGGIVVGDDWRDALEHGVNNAYAMLAFLSLNYFESEWCQRELKRADSLDIPIIPVKIGTFENSDLSIVLQDAQHVNFTNATDDVMFSKALDDVLAGLQKQTNIAPDATATSLPVEEAAAPYRTDVEDQIDTSIKEAEKIESSDSFAAMEAEELKADMQLVRKQYKAASEQYRLLLDSALRVQLEAQKAHYKAKAKEIEQTLKSLEV